MANFEEEVNAGIYIGKNENDVKYNNGMYCALG